MSVVIIDYGSGNLHSAAKAFERASQDSGLNVPVTVSSKPEEVLKASHIVLPGVGAYADCRAGLDTVTGMVEALEEAVKKQGKPFLGICVGMQLMATRGVEHGVTEGLGWIKGDVVPIKLKDSSLKIPHMGWNTLNALKPHPVLEGIKTGDEGLHAYFVHSYHMQVADRSNLLAEVDYGGSVTAMIAKDNMIGTQFHPEKSQALGLKLIANFLEWKT